MLVYTSHIFWCGEKMRTSHQKAPPKKQRLLRTRVHVVEDRRRLRRFVRHVGAGVQSGAQELSEAGGSGLGRKGGG